MARFALHGPFDIPGIAWCSSRIPNDSNSEYLAALGIAVPDEIRRSIPKRQREYVIGRLCAREAVRRLRPGFDSNIPTGSDRQPLFPAGITGSITHTDDFAAAACRPMEDGLLGIDVERVMTPERAAEVVPAVSSTDELGLDGWNDTLPLVRATLVFSAKEAAFKALYPKVHRFLEFSSSRLVGVDIFARVLQLSLTTDLGNGWCTGRVLSARFNVDKERVLTLVAVPHALR
ncbi:4'-phosphopantetheinyl transferase [Burkholderia cenocepacia]|uniref:4'-phosphopantetheinyl transferase family protein n=1 Tax=Burkholderia cenocepacia TaxID=95486 RepID=UPI00163A69E9|nr:4'-phosphopantetheinyl transferase superfamily protein [Burkholderia cenocepacia]